jgi:hypothetical protein
MKIIVGNDYYDNVLAYGHDDSIVFVRSRDDAWTVSDMTKKGVYLPLLDVDIRSIDNSKNHFRTYGLNQFYLKNEKKESIRHIVEPIVVIVAGKRFQGIKLSNDRDFKNVYFWSYEAFAAWLASVGMTHTRNHAWRDTDLKQYFEHKPVSKSVLDFLIEFKITILTFYKTTSGNAQWNLDDQKLWFVNSCHLRDVEFYKVMDAFTIFQEIEMFQGGVIANAGNKMVQITDNNIKIAKAGFDKFSFRKQKENT